MSVSRVVSGYILEILERFRTIGLNKIKGVFREFKEWFGRVFRAFQKKKWEVLYGP